MGTDILTYFH